MAAGLVTLTIIDGDGTERTARFWSSDGTVNGMLYPPAVLIDSTGTEISFAGGTAGAPAGSVSSVQGVTGMTPFRVTGTSAEYETVAASQTDQMMGASGAVGDTITGILVIPATTSPGAVSIEDGSTNTPVFAGGASSVSNLTPFFIPLFDIASVSGGWEITTGANVSCIVFGNFS
jgi:hypothetical protein